MTEWPNNGIEFNRWYSGITRFIQVLKHFQWIKASEFKYVNIRIDTRNGNFILLSEEKDGQRRRVDPNEIAQHVDLKLVDDTPASDLRTIRDRMAKLHNEAATHEGGYAISTGALFGFIQEIDKCLTNKT